MRLLRKLRCWFKPCVWVFADDKRRTQTVLKCHYCETIFAVLIRGVSTEPGAVNMLHNNKPHYYVGGEV